MIQYLPGYRRKAILYATAFGAAIIVVFSFIGGPVVAGPLGILFPFLVLFTCDLIAIRMAGRKANADVTAMVDLYDQGCDPKAFTDEAVAVVANVEVPDTEPGSWLVANYALALVDQGRLEDAAAYGKSLNDCADVLADGHPEIASTIYVNMEPLVLRLFGAQKALTVMDSAMECMERVTDASAQDKRRFIQWEADLLQAMISGDIPQLLQKHSHVRMGVLFPMRMRVLNAHAESVIHRSTGDFNSERICLEFVVANGNLLPVVAPARARLAELNAGMFYPAPAATAPAPSAASEPAEEAVSAVVDVQPVQAETKPSEAPEAPEGEAAVQSLVDIYRAAVEARASKEAEESKQTNADEE